MSTGVYSILIISLLVSHMLERTQTTTSCSRGTWDSRNMSYSRSEMYGGLLLSHLLNDDVMVAIKFYM